MLGVETKWRRLEDVSRGTETVLQGLEVILQIWRLGGQFSGAHGASAPHPASEKKLFTNKGLEIYRYLMKDLEIMLSKQNV